ncbi:MAM domain and Concanavalin A-like lectin/glucanases superfamily domain-containing protein [Aphelenchoides bicaudatus]|nr:MAM domain and Concanavalin A-like lectin/glucanases superfamily domain-containing protein [Aphelenchoides bicaudatus]
MLLTEDGVVAIIGNFVIRAALPNQNAFVTLSNTRLVNANGEEAACETTPGVFMPPVESQWAAGVPLMNGVLQTGGLTTMSDSAGTTMTPFLASISPLATGTPPLSGNPFSLPMMTPAQPLEFMKNLDAGVQAFQQQQQTSPTMIDGVTPIVLPQQFTFPTLAPFPSLFDAPLNQQNSMLPFLGQQPALTRPPSSSTTEPPPPDPFNDNDLVSKASGQNSLSLKELSEKDAFAEASETFARDNQLSASAQPIKGHQQLNGPDLTRFLGDMANRPDAEQKLRQLAQQFGLDFDRLANGKQLAALRKVFNGQQPLDLPASVGQTLNENDTRGMKPIRPENVKEEDFERVLQQEAQKRVSGQAISGDMLKKLAKLLNLTPSNPVDHDSPMARENLDFIFQNAMMNG